MSIKKKLCLQSNMLEVSKTQEFSKKIYFKYFSNKEEEMPPIKCWEQLFNI